MNARAIINEVRRYGGDFAMSGERVVVLPPPSGSLPDRLVKAVAANLQGIKAIISGSGDLFTEPDVPHDPDTAEIAALRQRLDKGGAHLWGREERGDIDAEDYAAQVVGFAAIQHRYEAACQAGWRTE